jgi:hypothetical protein
VCHVLSGRGLCYELITRPEESYQLCCIVVCDLETSRISAPYIYDISNLRVHLDFMFSFSTHISQLFTVHTEGNKIGHSIFSAWTEMQYIKRIFTVARCGSANQDLFMVHALRCAIKLTSYSSRTL